MDERLKFDVAVVGGGVAGVAAATTAAREGARVCLVERYGFPGGLSVAAEVGTLCGFFSTGTGISGLAGEFPEEVLNRYRTFEPSEKELHPTGLCYVPYKPVVLERVLADLLEEAGISCLYHTTATEIDFENNQLSLLVGNQPAVVEASSWVDASGEATLSQLGGLPVIEDNEYQAPGYVFRCENVDVQSLSLEGEDSESKGLSERLASMTLLRTLMVARKKGGLIDYGGISIVPGSVSSSALRLKFAYPFPRSTEFNESSRLESYGRKACFEIFNALRIDCPGFEDAELGHIAAQAGFRSGIRGKGVDILESKEVLGAVKHPDAIANGLWPVEYWGGDIKPELEFFPADDYFQIPVGSITSSVQENLFFAGRCLSADARAHSAARVIGTSLSTGAAAGRIAGLMAGGSSLSDSLSIHQLKEGLNVEEVGEVLNAS